MIYDVAKKWNLDSEVRNEYVARISESKLRNEKIRELESQLAGEKDYSSFPNHLNTLRKRINQMWNKQGFTNASDMHISAYNSIHVSLPLTPAKRIWSIDLPCGDDISELVSQFYSHHFDVYTDDGDYTYLYLNDHNRSAVSSLIESVYPGAVISNWKVRQTNPRFLLDSVDIHFTNISIIEEEVQ